MRSSISTLLAGAALTAARSLAQAAPTPAKYCSNASGNQDGLSTSDMTYGIDGPGTGATVATDCYGEIDNGHLGSSGGNASASIINQLWGNADGALTAWGDGAFVELVKKNTGQAGVGNTELGYTWSLDGSLAATTGTWTLSASPLDGLPAYFDFVGVLKGSDASAAYLFDEAYFDGSSGGSWAIAITNNGGKAPNLSNLTIFGRVGSTPPPCVGDDCGGGPPTAVPEPATLALVGLGLLGAGVARRRRH